MHNVISVVAAREDLTILRVFDDLRGWTLILTFMVGAAPTVGTVLGSFTIAPLKRPAFLIQLVRPGPHGLQ